MFICSRKMSARISDLEEAVEQARSRSGKLEKERNRLQVEIHEVVTQLEDVSDSRFYPQLHLSGFTTTIRLRFDGRSTAHQRSLRSQ